MGSKKTLIQLRDVSYRPVSSDHDILQGIDLDIHEGDFVLLLGPAGSGKTMLTHCFNGLIPHVHEGMLQGSVTVGGKDTQTHPIHELASVVGMVFQNPDDQIISLKVVNEVAWGVENQGLAHKEIVKRVEEFMDLLDISELRERLTFAISGGQKQKVSIASNLAMLQDVLVLDDPTTDLDPVCKLEVVEVLARLQRESGKTIVVIEHDLNDLIELSNRAIVMDKGRILFDAESRQLFTDHYRQLEELGVNIPQHIEIAHALSKVGRQSEQIPIHKEEAFARLRAFVEAFPPEPFHPVGSTAPNADPVVRMEKLAFAYQPDVPVLRGIDLDIFPGEFVAIVGANGSGKSTLIKTLTGLLTPQEGRILVRGEDTRKKKVADLSRDLGYVFQNPDDQLFTATVAEEVAFGLRVRKAPEDEIEKRVAEVLETVGLAHLRDKHPFSLSRGERQKLAVATALVHKPGIILLDEPTTGQDRKSLEGLMRLMKKLNAEGNTTVIITHDMEIVATHASRVLVMVEGKIIIDGPPQEVFYDHYETLRQLRLRPPTVVEFCHQLEGMGMPRFLTSDDLTAYIQEVPGDRIHNQ
jgi:energy-coupling factor transport system ATP-binding protein